MISLDVKTRIVLFLFFCILSMQSLAYTKITVRSQKDFNNLGAYLIKALDGKSCRIEVKILPGIYYFKSNQIKIENKSYPNKSIIIKAKGVKILSLGDVYNNGESFASQFRVNNAIITEGGGPVSAWTGVKYYNGLVEVLDDNSHLCRIKSEGIKNMREGDLSNSYIRIPQWFLMNTYKIKEIKNGYVYFVNKDLKKKSSGGWNVNDDFHYGDVKNIRYFLCNVERDSDCFSIVDGKVSLPDNIKTVRVCKSYQFLTINNCTFDVISISGLKILGNAWHMSYLFDLDNVITNVFEIKNCSFESIQSDVIAIKNSPNVSIISCKFKNCYRGCVFSDIDSPNTRITNCQFERVGLDFGNTAAVRCQGLNYLIANSTFLDYGYCAISLGYGKTRQEGQIVSGVTEFNKILYSKDYIRHYKNCMLMDGGAIYVMTQNDNCVIRYNSIYGHTGSKDNRGVFLDDGAYNVEIYGNVISNIENSYCIDSRRVASVENDGSRGANVTRTNINNKVYDNIVDGNIRFEPREGDDNGCLMGENYVAIGASEKGCVMISKNDYKKIQGKLLWKHFKEIVKVKNIKK